MTSGTFVHVCMHAFLYISVHVCLHARVHVCVSMCVFVVFAYVCQ